VHVNGDQFVDVFVQAVEQEKRRPKLSNKSIDNRNQPDRVSSVGNDETVDDVLKDVPSRHFDAGFEDRQKKGRQHFDVFDLQRSKLGSELGPLAVFHEGCNSEKMLENTYLKETER
jgi:hypothetical protein